MDGDTTSILLSQCIYKIWPVMKGGVW